MKVEMKLSGLDGVLATLQRLPPEVVSKNGGPVRRALVKGAVVIREQAKANFRSAVTLPGKSGITESTGFTADQIIIKRKAPLGGQNGERYIVAVRPKPHPSKSTVRRNSRAKPNSKRKRAGPKARTLNANDVAFMMEYGTSKQAATPWLRPAFEQKAAEAITMIERELVKGVDRLVKQLAKPSKGGK